MLTGVAELSGIGLLKSASSMCSNILTYLKKINDGKVKNQRNSQRKSSNRRKGKRRRFLWTNEEVKKSHENRMETGQ